MNLGLQLNTGAEASQSNTNMVAGVSVSLSSSSTKSTQLVPRRKTKTSQKHIKTSSTYPSNITSSTMAMRKCTSLPCFPSLSPNPLQTPTPPQQQPKQQQLPDPNDDSIDPDTFIKRLVEARCGFRPKIIPALDLKGDYFSPVTPEQLAAYDNDILYAGRDNNVAALKSLYENGHSVECCNRFGESLLHMACRRGFQEMAHFLLEGEPQLPVRIVDDCGRTPFHDTCWNSQPQTEICKLLLQRDPSLLLLSDKRGHTPFQYARQEHWGVWRQFLFENKMCLDVLKHNKELFS